MNNTYQRVNVTLPTETIRRLREVYPGGNRSQLINLALRRYLDDEQRALLRKQLEEGYKRNRVSARELADEWLPLEEEVWRKE
ncbi:MAG TPA: hypothetical protein VJK09_00990 [Candidatus Paceibacterota bacterium]